MYGIWLGIPLGFLTFLFGAHELVPYFHDFQTGSVAAIAAGLCVWMICRGIDILNDMKLDNPPAFDSHESVPLVLGKIHEFLKEAQVGPYNWQIRTLDTEETRILAVMKFQEFVNAVLPGSTNQLDRLILLNVYVEPKDKARTGTSTEEKPGTQITLKWYVDSAVHRTKVNQIITEGTRRIQEIVGAKPIEVRKAPHPMMPPQWMIAVLVCSLAMGLYKRDDYDKQVAAAAEQRARAQEQAEARREQIKQQWEQRIQQQRQSGYGISPNNPFAPSLDGGSTQSTPYQPSTGTSPLYSTPTWTPPPTQSGNSYDLLQPQTNPLTVPDTSTTTDSGSSWRAHY